MHPIFRLLVTQISQYEIMLHNSKLYGYFTELKIICQDLDTKIFTTVDIKFQRCFAPSYFPYQDMKTLTIRVNRPDFDYSASLIIR